MNLQDVQQWLSTAGTLLYYALLPLFYLALWLAYVFYRVISPFLYVLYMGKQALMMPVRFVAQFEALWYFLGAAAFIGAVLGLVLHLFMRVFTIVLKLEQKPADPSETVSIKGHDAQSYRAARQKKKQDELAKQQQMALQARLIAAQPLLQDSKREARGHIPVPHPASSISSPLSPGTQRPALLRETILEHTDEEDEDSAF